MTPCFNCKDPGPHKKSSPDSRAPRNLHPVVAMSNHPLPSEGFWITTKGWLGRLVGMVGMVPVIRGRGKGIGGTDFEVTLSSSSLKLTDFSLPSWWFQVSTHLKNMNVKFDPQKSGVKIPENNLSWKPPPRKLVVFGSIQP